MKNKKMKILVPALAILALGLGAASAGTVAWFTMTANASKADQEQMLTVTKPSEQGQDFVLRVEFENKGTLVKPSLTDNKGHQWVWVNDTLVDIGEAATGYGFAQLALHVYKYDKDATDHIGQEITTEAELKKLGNVGYSGSITGDERTRVSSSTSTVYSAAPGTSSVVYSVGIENGVKWITLSSDKTSNLLVVYYSVDGEDGATPDTQEQIGKLTTTINIA